MNKSACKYGFSLIELVVAIAIVAILAALAVPAYKSYRIKAKVVEVVDIINLVNDKAVYSWFTGTDIAKISPLTDGYADSNDMWGVRPNGSGFSPSALGFDNQQSPIDYFLLWRSTDPNHKQVNMHIVLKTSLVSSGSVNVVGASIACNNKACKIFCGSYDASSAASTPFEYLPSNCKSTTTNADAASFASQ